VEETGDGPSLICLHGLGGGASFFDSLREKLSDAARVVAFDMPGVGTNAKAVDRFSIESCVAALQQIVLCQPEGPVFALGHSMGTIVALRAREALAGMAKGYIFLGGLPRPVPEICDRLRKRIQEVKSHGLAAVSGQAMAGIFCRNSLERRGEMVEAFRRRFEANDSEAYCQAAEALIEADASDCVEGVNEPSFVITGEEDSYASPESARAFAGRLPSDVEIAVYEKCGHMIFVENPERLATDLRFFLQRNS